MQYVIYCRKSTDESSGQQTQSIPDQIEKCMKYAKDNRLEIALKPKDFPFETPEEIKREDSEADLYSRKVYQDTRDYYIIKEQKSGKMPGARPKWRKLISLIKAGKVKGLISYSPDRQARNMMEGGELINCVDEGLVELKYTNFHFENTASGKMMLGIWFVFSKQYSDKLSEDITRGKKTSVAKGKSQGKFKYGYMRDINDGYYKPHPTYFSLMKKAFELKLYDNKSDEYIASWLNESGFYRETKKENKEVNAKRLSNVWIDPFYYGIYIYGDSIIDLREITAAAFKPMITEEEHQELIDRYNKQFPRLAPKEIKQENEELMPLPRGFVRMTNGENLPFYIASKHRFIKRLQTLQKVNPDVKLQDIISSHQIRYRNSDVKSKYYGLEITYDKIEASIIAMLDKIKIDDKSYNDYLGYMKEELDNKNQENKEAYSGLLLQLNRTKSAKLTYVKKFMGMNKSRDEEEVYNNELSKYDNKIDFIQKEMNNINTSERNTIEEFQILIEILQNAGEKYRKGSYVQKRKITELFYTNIFVDNKKRLTFEVNPGLDYLFSSFLSSTGDNSILLNSFMSDLYQRRFIIGHICTLLRKSEKGSKLLIQ